MSGSPSPSAPSVDETSTQTTGVSTGLDLFGDDRRVVAMRVDGEAQDLSRPVPEGAAVEPILIDSPDGLAILRHSAAHVAAQAVQNLHPDAKLGIGPPITDGFYYDFDLAEPFTPESLREVEKTMLRIVKCRSSWASIIRWSEPRVAKACLPRVNRKASWPTG